MTLKEIWGPPRNFRFLVVHLRVYQHEGDLRDVINNLDLRDLLNERHNESTQREIESFDNFACFFDRLNVITYPQSLSQPTSLQWKDGA